jgi:ribosomal protein L37AE/L43A
MEKYGVQEHSEKVAEITDSTVCPVCGSQLTDRDQTGVLVCPKCGTKPFED